MASSRGGGRRIVVVVAVLIAAGAVLGGFFLFRSSGSATSGPSGGAATTTSSTASAPNTGGSGFLHTSGTRILNTSGHVVQLTGFNVEGMESTNVDGSDVLGRCNDAWRPLSSSEVGQIAAYGFKTVRLPIAWGNIEPTAPTVGSGGILVHHWNTAYLTALQNEVQLFGNAGMRVILDMHQATWGPAFVTPSTSKKPSCPGEGMPTWLNPNAASETSQKASCEFYEGKTEPGVPGTAWSDFSAAESYVDGLFADDAAMVGQDVVNEPSCGNGSADLHGFYDEVAPAIHQANPHILIILEDKENPGSYLLSTLPPVGNIVLSIHLHEDYWSTPSGGQSSLPYSGQAVLVANEARATQWNVPLYVGEFYGFDGAGSQNGLRQPDANYIVDTRSFISYCAQNDISWTYWTWTQKKNPEIQPEITSQMLGALGPT
jgi:aryl-phospho-beta-D-glucosidase BglC (GH1 family)